MSFSAESGGLAAVEMKVVQESHTHKALKILKQMHLTTSAPSCPPFSGEDGLLPCLTSLFSDDSCVFALPLLPFLGPACSAQGDPPAVLEHTVITMFTKRLLGNSCL